MDRYAADRASGPQCDALKYENDILRLSPPDILVGEVTLLALRCPL